MGHLNIISIALALVIGNSYFGELDPGYITTKSTAAYEISNFFKKDCLDKKKEITADVVFSINKKREINIHSIDSDDKEIKEYVINKFQDRKLKDKKWSVNKCYSLPVKIKLAK